jgi:hypothetical protein
MISVRLRWNVQASDRFCQSVGQIDGTVCRRHRTQHNSPSPSANHTGGKREFFGFFGVLKKGEFLPQKRGSGIRRQRLGTGGEATPPSHHGSARSTRPNSGPATPIGPLNRRTVIGMLTVARLPESATLVALRIRPGSARPQSVVLLSSGRRRVLRRRDHQLLLGVLRALFAGDSGTHRVPRPMIELRSKVRWVVASLVINFQQRCLTCPCGTTGRCQACSRLRSNSGTSGKSLEITRHPPQGKTHKRTADRNIAVQFPTDRDLPRIDRNLLSSVRPRH